MSHCIALSHMHTRVRMERIGNVQVDDGDFVASLEQAFNDKAAHKATAKCHCMTHSVTSGSDPP